MTDNSSYDDREPYPLKPDLVLPYSKLKYPTFDDAFAVFAARSIEQGYILVGSGEDARHWVFKVVKRRG